MAAGDTSLSICSDALVMLGAKPISSFDEGTDEASISDRLYGDIKNQALMLYPWSFSFKKLQLLGWLQPQSMNINTNTNCQETELDLLAPSMIPMQLAYIHAKNIGSWVANY